MAQTYTTFQAMVADHLHRSDLTTQIPDFIEAGRIRMSQVLRVPDMGATGTVTITSGAGTLPTGTVQVLSVKDTYELRQVPLEEIPIYDSGVYAIRGLTLLVPGGSSVTVSYLAAPATLLGAAGSATRTVLDAFPQIWLQAALIEAYRWLDDERNEAKAAARFAEEVAQANSSATKLRLGVAGFVSGPQWVEFSTGAR